jgi:protein ImuA
MPLANLPGLDLIRPGRVHEAAGPGRRVFAAALAGRLAGPVLWVQEGRERDRLCPQGLAAFFDPARLLLARPAGALAVLQVTEEALRSGAVALVVAELAEAPDLTASRRLQLAAGTGGGRGLCLVPQSRTRANAAETRWHCVPLPGGPQTGGTQAKPRQFWELVKNKRGRLGAWEVGGEVGGEVDPGAPLRETPSPPARHEPRLASASP